MTPSCPWLVNGSSATSVMTPRSGNSFFSARTTRGTSPSAFCASRPSGVFSDGSMTGKSASTGMPSFAVSSAMGSSRSSDTRSTPGIDGTACRRPVPSCTNTG